MLYLLPCLAFASALVFCRNQRWLWLLGFSLAVSLSGCGDAGDTKQSGGVAAPVEDEVEEAESLLPEGDLMTARVHVMDAENDLAADTARARQAHAQLTAVNAQLNQNDQAAVAAYNKMVEAYSTQKVILEGKRAKVAAMRKELEKMIDSSPRGSGNGTAATAPAPAGEVVIYTTRTCPACVMAKNYFSSRRIPYREMDVESSEAARQEWEKFNARGVPVIVVKGQVIHGFDQGKIEQLLGGKA